MFLPMLARQDFLRLAKYHTRRCCLVFRMHGLPTIKEEGSTLFWPRGPNTHGLILLMASSYSAETGGQDPVMRASRSQIQTGLDPPLLPPRAPPLSAVRRWPLRPLTAGTFLEPQIPRPWSATSRPGCPGGCPCSQGCPGSWPTPPCGLPHAQKLDSGTLVPVSLSDR